MMEIVTSNVIASRAPECRLTGTPTAHANTSIVPTKELSHCLKRCTNCNIPLPAQSKIASRGPKQVNSKVFGHACKFLLNKFFDKSSSSMRNIDNGERKKGKKD